MFRKLSQKNSIYQSYHYFSIVNFDVKQFCVKLQKLFTNKGLHHGNSIPFLDMEVYMKNNKLYTKIYREETDRQNFLHINSEHPVSLKHSKLYSQVLRVKRTCSTIENSNLYCSELNTKIY